jgi:hypothetical protein
MIVMTANRPHRPAGRFAPAFDKNELKFYGNEARGENMDIKITDVESHDEDSFSVTLENGHSFIFGLGELICEPAFVALTESEEFDEPRTDGTRLYWRDGPSLSFDEIMTALAGGCLANRTIERVEAYGGDPEEIDIYLDNDNLITILLNCKRNEPLFAEIAEERFIPKTDGKRVYWYNGASLTLEEIMAMLRTDNDGNF